MFKITVAKEKDDFQVTEKESLEAYRVAQTAFKLLEQRGGVRIEEKWFRLDEKVEIIKVSWDLEWTDFLIVLDISDRTTNVYARFREIRSGRIEVRICIGSTSSDCKIGSIIIEAKDKESIEAKAQVLLKVIRVALFWKRHKLQEEITLLDKIGESLAPFASSQIFKPASEYDSAFPEEVKTSQ